jgi:hypothetical protein
LKDVAKLDNRIEAHIDDLRIAGDYGWGLAVIIYRSKSQEKYLPQAFWH